MDWSRSWSKPLEVKDRDWTGLSITKHWQVHLLIGISACQVQLQCLAQLMLRGCRRVIDIGVYRQTLSVMIRVSYSLLILCHGFLSYPVHQDASSTSFYSFALFVLSLLRTFADIDVCPSITGPGQASSSIPCSNPPDVVLALEDSARFSMATTWYNTWYSHHCSQCHPPGHSHFTSLLDLIQDILFVSSCYALETNPLSNPGPTSTWNHGTDNARHSFTSHPPPPQGGSSIERKT